VVGVKTGHVACPITPRRGTLDLSFLWPGTLWITWGTGRRNQERRMSKEGEKKGDEVDRKGEGSRGGQWKVG